MQKRFQQFTDIALDTFGLSKIEDEQLIDHLNALDQLEKELRYSIETMYESRRELEKACNEVDVFFEQARESTANVVVCMNNLIAANDQNPIIKNNNLHFRNLNQLNESALGIQIVID